MYARHLVMLVQADFNARFEAARTGRQGELDKILDANNRMKDIWEEQARLGVGWNGAAEGSLFKPLGGSWELDDAEDDVLSVKVLVVLCGASV